VPRGGCAAIAGSRPLKGPFPGLLGCAAGRDRGLGRGRPSCGLPGVYPSVVLLVTVVPSLPSWGRRRAHPSGRCSGCLALGQAPLPLPLPLLLLLLPPLVCRTPVESARGRLGPKERLDPPLTSRRGPCSCPCPLSTVHSVLILLPMATGILGPLTYQPLSGCAQGAQGGAGEGYTPGSGAPRLVQGESPPLFCSTVGPPGSPVSLAAGAGPPVGPGLVQGEARALPGGEAGAGARRKGLARGGGVCLGRAGAASVGVEGAAAVEGKERPRVQVWG